MSRRVAVVISPPARAMARVEAFRRVHDPLSARIRAHVTLVFPMIDGATVDLRRRLAHALSDAGAFPVVLRGAGRYPDGTVYLRVASGGRAVAALHRALTDALLGEGARDGAPAYRPHLTVARAGDSASARRLARAATALGPIEFHARVVSLMEEMRSGRWRAIARVGLHPPAPPGPARGQPARTMAR